MVRDYAAFGKPSLVLDETKLSLVTCQDMRDKFPDWDTSRPPFIVHLVCDGALLEVNFKADQQPNWTDFYEAVKTAVYRNGSTPMPAEAPPQRTELHLLEPDEGGSWKTS